MSDLLSPLAAVIFPSLKEMDAEAHPHGLYDYGRFVCSEGRKPSAENCWSSELASRLRQRPWTCDSQGQYPGSKQSCDLIVTGSNGRIWVEVKGGWKDYWADKGNPGKFRSWLYDSTATDIDKLAALDQNHAAYVGLLLVGFEYAHSPMDDEVEKFKKRKGLGGDPWREWKDDWPDPWRQGHRVRCWLWIRPT